MTDKIIPCPYDKCGGSPAGVIAGVCLMCLAYSSVPLELELEKHDGDSGDYVYGVDAQHLRDVLKALDAFREECVRLQAENAKLQEIARDNYDSYEMKKALFDIERSRLDELERLVVDDALRVESGDIYIIGDGDSDQWPTLRAAADSSLSAPSTSPEK